MEITDDHAKFFAQELTRAEQFEADASRLFGSKGADKFKTV